MGMDFLVGVKVKTTGAEKIDALEQKIEKLKSQNIDIKVNITGAEFLKDISKSLGSVNKFATSAGTSAGNSYYNAMQQSARKTEVLYRDMWKRLSSQTNQFKLDQAANKLTQLSKNDMSAYSGTAGFNQYKANIAQATTLQERLNAEIAKGQNMNMDSFNADLKEMNSLLAKSSTLYQNLTKPIGAFEAQTASNRTLSWLNNNTKATKELGNAFVDLAKKQEAATTVGELQKYNKEFTSLTSLAQSKGLTGNSFFAELGRGFKQIGQFVGTYGVLQKGVQIFKEMATSVREVDDATTELRKVSTASSQDIAKYYDQAAESAKKYGQTISDVISSTADWSRLGYNLKDSKVLSDMTTLYQNVGDNMTQESAAESMVSTLQGFQLSADQASHIVDSFNEVDKLAS